MNYKKGVTAIICTLNSEKDLMGTLESIKSQTLKPSQIIITDGGSTDDTEKIAKTYTHFFVKSKPGFFNQITKLIPLISYEKVWTVEVDHRYPRDFLENFCEEHEDLNSDGTQANLVCVSKNNYLERAFAYTYEKNKKHGKVDFISGPALWNTDNFKLIYKELAKIESPEKLLFSIDTFQSEIIRKFNFNCNQVNVIAYQKQDLNLKTIFKKYFNYGEGDYFFYKNFAKQWTFYRKLKSLTHVLRKHFLLISLHSIKDLKIHYIPFFMISSFFRYLGFLNKILR